MEQLILETISRHVKDETIHLYHSKPVSHISFLSLKMVMGSTETDFSPAQSAL